MSGSKVLAGVICAIGIFFTVQAAGENRSFPGKEQWETAKGNRNWSFPADHGAHKTFRTEWWYFTGNLNSPSGDFNGGYQLTFFRAGLNRQPAVPVNPWSVSDLYLAHFTLTDGSNRKFYWTERVSRTGPGLAGSREDGLKVWLHDWKAELIEESIHLRARSGGMALDLILLPGKPPVIHGKEGLSRKGPAPGQASWYYSMTRMDTRGTIGLSDGTTLEVEGRSWFDHEFGSNQLTEDQAGWDWFGLHLSSGAEIMIYVLRRVDGSVEPVSSGTFIAPDGSQVHLPLEDFSVQATGKWRSPASSGTYPSGWRIRIPGKNIDIRIAPVLENQELTTQSTAGITYWEGAVTLEGQAGGKKVAGAGYVELTGYAGSMGGIF